MANKLKQLIAILVLVFAISSCKKINYSLGELTAPSNIVITESIVGKTATAPYGDGSGVVKFTVTADNALSYNIDYDLSDGIKLSHLPKGTSSTKYLTAQFPAVQKTFKVTVVVYGKGGASSSITKDITVLPSPEIVINLIGTGTKTWAVEKAVAAHFGVGPFGGSVVPEWYTAAPNEKEGCCKCFYSTNFKFSQVPNTSNFTLEVISPDGAFTKTGALAGGLPNIPASGPEGCYNSYTGGTSSFSFISATSGIAANTPSTQTSILLGGTNTYIGYGAQLKEYEIMTLTATNMYLRVQGTETGNAWYLKLKALP